MMTHEETSAMFEYFNSISEKMTYGDSQFAMSLQWHFQKNGTLSNGQDYHLERLGTKYSMEEISRQEQFEQDYNDELRLTALRCARYYDGQNPRYYGSIVDKVLSDTPNHTLNYNEFNKMCNNKYAKKILAAYDTPHKFSSGDMVQIRSNNRIDIANTNTKDGHVAKGTRSTWRLANKICMVLEVNSKPITRPAKGARIYKVLIIDETSPIYAHESDLKKVRRLKK
jgi:hypothetical protein